MTSSDPRLTPVRPDLAARYLQGIVSATRFVDAEMRAVITAVAPVRRAPAHDAALDTEAFMGERVRVYETRDDGWSWGQLESDDYVGWIPSASLGDASELPTHQVIALRTFVFPGPSIKLPPIESPPLGAQLSIERIEPPLALLRGGGFVPLRHLAAITTHERDWTSVAERFLGVPYLWGGKTSAGIDCSGLVQVALRACGVPCPRDSDMQENAVGTPLDVADALGALQRGDLVFWKGHVALARDASTLIHANAHHMAVAIEPIAEAVSRIRATGSDVTSVRRPTKR